MSFHRTESTTGLGPRAAARRWLEERVQPATDIEPTADELVGFSNYASRTAARIGRLFVVGLILVLIVWWPLDPVVFAGQPAVVVRYALWRGVLIAWLAGIWLIVPNAWVERNQTGIYCLVLYPGMAWTAWCMAALGGMDGPWFYYLVHAPMFSFLLLKPFWRRTVVTGGASLVLLAAFLLGAPEATLEHPNLQAGVSFLGFTTLTGIVLGDGAYRLVRANFVRQARIAGHEQELLRVKTQLEIQVADQTQDLRRLASHLDALREQERGRMARELHDELGQELTALRYGAAVARAHATPGSLVDGALEQLEELLERTKMTTRRLLSGLRPKILDTIGLVAAARWLARSVGERTGLEVRVLANRDEVGVSPELARAAYRIVQEALTNVERHAGAERVEIHITRSDTTLDIRIDDDGAGLPADRDEHEAERFGLLGIRERALRFGGRAEFETAALGGLSVHVRMAVDAGGEP